MLGCGTNETEYRDLARALGVEHSVTFAGMVVQNTVSEILAGSDVILSPLTGRALAEGMLSSTPVVAYDVDCHPDFIDDGKNGFLVPFRDFASMAERSLELLSDQYLRKELGSRGRETALNMLNPERLVEEQRNQFTKIIELG